MAKLKPNEDETQREFIARCMEDEGMAAKYVDREARSAACYIQWRTVMGKSLSEGEQEVLDKALQVIQGKPYPNEHACRLRPPGDFQKETFRRVSRKHDGKEYDVIIGKLKGETTMSEQAYRYPKGTWDVEEARSHCKAHDGTFEAAKKGKADDESEGERKYNCECIECGHKLKTDEHCANIKCPKCGGQMRRAERPGPGQPGKELDTHVRLEKPSPKPDLKVAPLADVAEGKKDEGDAGWMEGHGAAFGNVDGQGERIKPGAFKKTIKERVPAGKVKLMVRHYAHGGDTLEVIGTVTEAKEDDFGLWIHAEFSATPIAQETRQKIVEGHVNGLSIGYIPKKWTDTEEGGKSVRDLLEIMLLEVTVTTIPANELATITAAKAATEAAEALRRDVNAPCESEGKEGRVLSARNRSRVQSTLESLRKLSDELESLLKETEPKASAEGRTALHSWGIQVKRHRLALERLALDAKSFSHNSKVAEGEPAWGKVDKAKLPRLAFADMGKPESVSTWRYPHHWVKGGGSPDDSGRFTTGTLYLHKGGLNAAWAAAQGARSGEEASAAVKGHLQKHRKALGLEEG